MMKFVKFCINNCGSREVKERKVKEIKQSLVPVRFLIHTDVAKPDLLVLDVGIDVFP